MNTSSRNQLLPHFNKSETYNIFNFALGAWMIIIPILTIITLTKLCLLNIKTELDTDF